MAEELAEFSDACGMIASFSASTIDDVTNDLAGQADALVDLVYFAIGTAIMLGLPFEELWNDAHRANMTKVRGATHRGHPNDVTKPEGWVPPKTVEILSFYGYRP